jgi:hypothetical protein
MSLYGVVADYSWSDYIKKTPRHLKHLLFVYAYSYVSKAGRSRAMSGVDDL